ncbi:MraW family SAM-dependent methyltransferase [Tetragenococcus muriaticus PMC-11-5]|uniref:MraW family SAM-dependent methyltransferase n=1 Tax=Tetragenococcus muriaticus PMC-11-5 TaxID=1302649 RepID=A0A091C9V9_9ENTE|nr:class I SAM-dependent methyltransferase [Tetragenococcus muriaticus]KFN93675.1 MraW family SAM-dependent methyltransferase [Tetragenococcus muriaticus PMC-11-5]GMA48304.1 rRNA methyltransferase [Tetragenococcus muriaticus]
MIENALQFSHTLLAEVLTDHDHVVDATMGNGNDTVFLANKVQPHGKVYAFDVQKQALDKTKQRLLEDGLTEQTKIIFDGHENLKNYLAENEPIKAGIFNLGYLPKSDKQLITTPTTTKQALETLLNHLVSKGRILLVSYYGHAGGKEELTMLDNYCQKLPQEQYNVLRYQFINQKNRPPILFCIEKK